MAAKLILNRAKISEAFSFGFLSRTFCAVAPKTEKTIEDVLPKKKEKKKDFKKMAAYEEYRNAVKNTRDAFKVQYEAKQAMERRRVEEINQGSFSPLEQHKKAVEEIRKYNENKEFTRMGRQEERMKRLNACWKKGKEVSKAWQLKKNRELVLKVIEESKSFVTIENLEEKIQEVLSMETNYNFAVTADGTKIMSKEPPNNLGIEGPGPLAYHAAGLKFKDNAQGNWKVKRKLTVVDGTDESESSESDSDSSESDSESSENDRDYDGSGGESSENDSGSRDDDDTKKPGL